MQPILFIADLHLCAQRPQTNHLFQQFIDEVFLPQSETLYILGDLFEFWIGDDGAEKLGFQDQIALLAELSQQGKKLYFMAGNRDFLIGKQFSQATGIEIINDPIIIDLNGQKCLLKHGDDLCTDDVEHQQFRQMTRTPQWQQEILSKTVDERLMLASQVRQLSGSNKPADIMDVNTNAVEKQFIESGADIMIHGHTHRPNIHQHIVNGIEKRRYVLGDWHQQISYIKADEKGLQLL